MKNQVALKEKVIQEALKLFSLRGFLITSIHDIMRGGDHIKG
jgi:hypothetical protein